MLLRGGIQLEVNVADHESTTLNAEGMLSWQEYRIDRITSLHVVVTAGERERRLALGTEPLRMVSELHFGDEVPPASNVVPDVPERPDNAFDELFGATMYGDIELAAVRNYPDPESAIEHPAPEHTTQSEQRNTSDETSSTYAFNGSRVMVPAQHCPYGHPNPPEATQCWSCKAAIQPGPVASAVRPSLGWLEFNDGKRIPVDRNILIGRNPAIHRLAATELPKLVTVESPNQDISRNHLSVLLDGWRILLDDLNTTNGTTVREPTGAIVKLIPGQPYLAVTGCRVQLGDGVEFWLNGVGA